MEKTLQVLNNMEKDGIIKRYAIGGGLAVVYYTEPFTTFDLDVFCFLQTKAVKSADSISLAPIYGYLQEKGYKPQDEHIVIEGVPVQFIPAYNELVEEALEEAVEIKYGETETRILRAEYLLGILLQTNRLKDRDRVRLLLGQAQIDQAKAQSILIEYGLLEKLNRLKEW